MSLKKANEHRNAWFEGVQKCTLDESLFTVMEKIVRAEVHRLVVTDENSKVIGIISLSDILLYLVLRPCGEGLGDCESLRASDPILKSRERLDSSSLMYNRSNESIEEETNNELEAEASKLSVEENESDKINNNSGELDENKVESGEDAQTTEDKTDDILEDNGSAQISKSESEDHLAEVHVIKSNDEPDEEEQHLTKDNGNLNLNIQREVAMVSE